jgi:POT family
MQAQYMNCRVSVSGMQLDVPPASMAMFDTVSIIVLIPIYDGILHPLMKRLRCELSMLQRIGWGFLLAALAMLVAGLVERRRLDAVAAGGNIGIMTQVLQYTLVGSSEVLASIGQIEFFYDQVRSCAARGTAVVHPRVYIAGRGRPLARHACAGRGRPLARHACAARAPRGHACAVDSLQR